MIPTFKICLIFGDKESTWVSCSKINENLKTAYGADCLVHHLYSENNHFEIIENIIRQDIRVIAFLDHQVRPMEILRSPKLLRYIHENKVKVILHLFGCFFDRISEYYQIGQLLKNQDVQFVAASTAHLKLIEKTLKNTDSTNVHYVPFPVAAADYRYDHKLGQQMRLKLGLSKDDIFLCYTGRISAFKNIEMSMELLQHVRKSRREIKFLFAGSFDGLENSAPSLKVLDTSSTNAAQFNKVDPDHEWIKYLPFLQKESLRALLCAADGFISLSLTRGEDFGMAVAEAKISGLPAFLSDWAGYRNFVSLPHTYSAPVNLEKADIKISLEPLASALLTFKPLSEKERNEVSQATDAAFGIKHVTHLISQLVAAEGEPFEGFNPKIVIRKEITSINNSINTMTELKDFYEPYWA